MPDAHHVDLAIVGSGSGNSLVTPDFDDLEIAIIEAGTFGGTCLNVGCIPTKMYVHTAEIAHTIRVASRFGIDATVDKVRWADIRDRIFARIDAISENGRDYRAHGPNTTLFEAEARFAGERTLALSTGETITADRVVLANGSRPTIPAVVTASGVPYHTSDTVMRIEDVPERLVILGGGYIAAELAHVFASLGSAVTVVARGPRMLRHLDEDLSRPFSEAAGRQWDVRLQAEASAIARTPDGLRVTLADGTAVDGDLLLVATGRHPNSDRLDASRGGVELHPDGRIAVDQYQRTSAEGVWALGDVSSPYQLKHVANHEARVVAHIATDHRFVPSAVFSRPHIATVGRREQDLRAAGVRYVSYHQDFGATASGWAAEDTTSFCKLLADPRSGQLLGVHVLGPFAATLIQPLIQAMSTGQSVRGLADAQYWIHPALSEVVENALIGLESRLDPA
jgi:mycothione reductase